MATLHTVNKSPFERNALASCLNHLLPGDAVLMIEDAVVGARKGTALESQIKGAMGECAVYALSPDLVARGIKPDDLVDGIKLVDYGGFVDLVAVHARAQAWL